MTVSQFRPTLRALVAGLASVACLVSLAAPAAGAPAAGTPTSFDQSVPSLQSVPLTTLTLGTEVDALRAAAEAKDGQRAPMRFATPIELELGFDAGRFETLDDGSRLWRLRVASPGALSLSFAFDVFELADGAQLWIYAADGTQVRGPFTRSDAFEGKLWTPLVVAEEAVIELHEPAKVVGQSRVQLWRAHHGFRGPGERTPKQGSCNVDVICPEGDAWRDQIRGVAVYSLNGIDFCSGMLINNVREDGRPLFLTADHCQREPGFDGFPGMVVYWNYESPTCGALSGGDKFAQSTAGASLLAFDITTDFAVLELASSPDPSYNAYFVGWDARGTAAPSVVGIHHPSTDEKAISFENDPVVSVTEIDPSFESHWQVTDWDVGTTEPGSSGSPIFNTENQLVVGTLTGGFAACGNDFEDFYGKLSEQMNRGLRAVLDPDDTGATTLAGRNATGGGGGGGTGGEGCDDTTPFTCTSSGTSHCLQAGRFQVSVEWATGLDSGDASVVPGVVSDDSGLFYFFDPNNWEMLVKVLDACSINQHFWVFAAATTDLELTLRVADSETGEVVCYENSAGMAAPAITDTGAFATCP